MSFSYSYNPRVANPYSSVINNPQMMSDTSKPTFYFGGAQAPIDLGLKKSKYDGSKGSGLVSSMNRGLGHHIVQSPNGKKQIARIMPFM